jgi:uncharacterized Zn finger protein
LRGRLLKELRATRGWQHGEAKVDIFLSEGLVEDAIAAVSRGEGTGQLGRVMDAALKVRPAWVIAEARKRAEPIISAGKADHYAEAVAWLRHARDAYLAQGQAEDWQHYLAQLRGAHGRKYKLMGLLLQLER